MGIAGESGTRPRLLAAALALTFSAAVAGASSAPPAPLWSADPAHPFLVADGASEQVQAKIVALADGGFYVSWFDNASGGYDVRLQRLSANGVEVWPHNGILVADRGLSSTTDYGLAIDEAGNALLAFNDDSEAVEAIVAAKISPQGLPLWGTPGIRVSTFDGFLASPRIAATGDGEVVVAWTQGDAALDAVLQRLDTDGNKLWATDGLVLAHTGDNFLVADLLAAGSDVIVSWVRYVTFMGDKHLWAQKLDPDGGTLWVAANVHVFDLAGSSLQFGNFPEMTPDGSGGAAFAWYTSTPALQTRAQRLLANGNEAFAHNGVELSTDAVRSRVDPHAVFDSLSGHLIAFWVETNALQNQFGLYGQRLDAIGNRLWNATGLALVALGPSQISQVRPLLAPQSTFASADRPGDAAASAAPIAAPIAANDTIVAWVESLAFDNEPIRARRLDAGGVDAWAPATKTVKSAATGTSRLAAATSLDGFAAYAWTDGESARDLAAQNLRLDGTLGATPLFADGFESNGTGNWSMAFP